MNEDNAITSIQRIWKMIRERKKFLNHMKKTKTNDKFGNSVASAQLYNIFLLKIYEEKRDSCALVKEFNAIFHEHFAYLKDPIVDIPNGLLVLVGKHLKSNLDGHNFTGGEKIRIASDSYRKYDMEFIAKKKDRQEVETEVCTTLAGTTEEKYTPKQFINFFPQTIFRAIENYTFSSRSPMFNTTTRIPLVGHVSGTALFFLNHVLEYAEKTKAFTDTTKDMCFFYFIVLGIFGHHDFLECIYALDARKETTTLFKIEYPILKSLVTTGADSLNYFTLLRKFFALNAKSCPEYLTILNKAIDEYYLDKSGDKEISKGKKKKSVDTLLMKSELAEKGLQAVWLQYPQNRKEYIDKLEKETNYDLRANFKENLINMDLESLNKTRQELLQIKSKQPALNRFFAKQALIRKIDEKIKIFQKKVLLEKSKIQDNSHLEFSRFSDFSIG